MCVCGWVEVAAEGAMWNVEKRRKALRQCADPSAWTVADKEKKGRGTRRAHSTLQHRTAPHRRPSSVGSWHRARPWSRKTWRFAMCGDLIHHLVHARRRRSRKEPSPTVQCFACHAWCLRTRELVGMTIDKEASGISFCNSLPRLRPVWFE